MSFEVLTVEEIAILPIHSSSGTHNQKGYEKLVTAIVDEDIN